MSLSASQTHVALEQTATTRRRTGWYSSMQVTLAT
jgi:hypothetical protein